MNGLNKLLSLEIIVKLPSQSKNQIWISLISRKEKWKWKKMKLFKLKSKEVAEKKVKKKKLKQLVWQLMPWEKKLNMKNLLLQKN